MPKSGDFGIESLLDKRHKLLERRCLDNRARCWCLMAYQKKKKKRKKQKKKTLSMLYHKSSFVTNEAQPDNWAEIANAIEMSDKK